jgi:hypothetical protein
MILFVIPEPGMATMQRVLSSEIEAALALVEKQISEAKVNIAKQWKYAVRLESSGADTEEVRLLLARLEDAQLHRIQCRNFLRQALRKAGRTKR